jgi:hypothetical protein
MKLAFGLMKDKDRSLYVQLSSAAELDLEKEP